MSNDAWVRRWMGGWIGGLGEWMDGWLGWVGRWMDGSTEVGDKIYGVF